MKTVGQMTGADWQAAEENRAARYAAADDGYTDPTWAGWLSLAAPDPWAVVAPAGSDSEVPF